ncbi:hypothetical protein [Streptomyces asiaticus]
MKDHLIAALGVALLLALTGGAAWAWTSAPCGLWSLSAAGDIPARCITK